MRDLTRGAQTCILSEAQPGSSPAKLIGRSPGAQRTTHEGANPRSSSRELIRIAHRGAHPVSSPGCSPVNPGVQKFIRELHSGAHRELAGQLTQGANWGNSPGSSLGELTLGAHPKAHPGSSLGELTRGGHPGAHPGAHTGAHAGSSPEKLTCAARPGSSPGDLIR